MMLVRLLYFFGPCTSSTQRVLRYQQINIFSLHFLNILDRYTMESPEVIEFDESFYSQIYICQNRR